MLYCVFDGKSFATMFFISAWLASFSLLSPDHVPLLCSSGELGQRKDLNVLPCGTRAGTDPKPCFVASTLRKQCLRSHPAMPSQVICVHDVSSIYRVPLLLESQGVVGYLSRRLNMPIETRPRKMLTKWKEMSDRWVLKQSCSCVMWWFWSGRLTCVVFTGQIDFWNSAPLLWWGNTPSSLTRMLLSSKHWNTQPWPSAIS